MSDSDSVHIGVRDGVASGSEESDGSVHLQPSSTVRDWPIDPRIWCFLLGNPLLAEYAITEDLVYQEEIKDRRRHGDAIFFGFALMRYTAVPVSHVAAEQHNALYLGKSVALLYYHGTIFTSVRAADMRDWYSSRLAHHPI